MSRPDDLVKDASSTFFLTTRFFRPGSLAVVVLIFPAIVAATVAALFRVRS